MKLKSKKQVNVALIGAGKQGRTLLASLLRMGSNSNIKIQAICDIWLHALKNVINRIGYLKKMGHPLNTYTDYCQMLDKEDSLDAVFIATPDFCHDEQAIKCMTRGLEVYCEPPMSNSIQSARCMVYYSRQMGRLLQIGYQRRSNPFYRYCAEKLVTESNILHRITNINGQKHEGREKFDKLSWPKGSEIDQKNLKEKGYAWMDELVNWRNYKCLSSGLFAEMACHQLDVYSWFLGEADAKSIQACGVKDYRKDNQWHDNVSAIIEYAPAQGNVRASYEAITTNSSRGSFEVFMGDRGTLEMSETPGRGSAYREAWLNVYHWEKWVNDGILLDVNNFHKQVRILSQTDLEEKEGKAELDARLSPPRPQYAIPVIEKLPAHFYHVENFINAIRGEEKLNCPAEVAFKTTLLTLLANQAVETEDKLEIYPSEEVLWKTGCPMYLM